MSYSADFLKKRVGRQVLSDLPGLVAMAGGDTTSGMSRAAHSYLPQLNLGPAAAYATQVVPQKKKVVAALKLQEETTQHSLLMLGSRQPLINLHKDDNTLTDLVANSHDTNLAIAHEVLRTCANQLN